MGRSSGCRGRAPRPDADVSPPSSPSPSPGDSPTTPPPTAGPKPSAPRNVTVRETPAGVLVTWQPPANSSVPIAFYCVEYRSPDKPWARSTNIMTGSEYTSAYPVSLSLSLHIRKEFGSEPFSFLICCTDLQRLCQ